MDGSLILIGIICDELTEEIKDCTVVSDFFYDCTV